MPPDKKDPLDLGNILLPKKPTPGGSLDSASRGDAGELLKRETAATLPVPPKPAPPSAPKKDEPVVKALETYQGDIEEVVGKQNTSMVSIAAAEATRRAQAALPATEPRKWVSQTVNMVLIGGGIILLVGAALAVWYVARPAPSVSIAPDAPAPFLFVDQTYGFSVPLSSFKRSTAMNALEAQREKIALSLGLVGRIYLAIPPTTEGGTATPLSVAQLLQVLAPNAPDLLLRSIDPYEYLLGVHSYDVNQAFLILRTQSYEQTFSGMLNWEPNMRQDLNPLFSRTPSPHQGNENADLTAAQNKFVDRIVENHDTRVIENPYGDILLLWGFVDRNTLVITTNEATFREIISRLKTTPVVPLP
jgi:hypothetical protein